MNKITLLIYSLISGCFTFFVTSLGASIVFLFRKINKTILDISLAISAGIMLSSSFFSLIKPAIEMVGKEKIILLGISFCMGGLLLIIFECFYKKNNKNKSISKTELLLFSITLHNIPEGLIIGISYGSLMYESGKLIDSILLTIAIAIQNFPEGCAISMPLLREKNSKLKSFVLGSLSGIVEPISAVIGCLLVIKIKGILPYLLMFAAGTMVFVVIEELIPEYNENKKKALINFSAILGFTIMMILDVFFG